MNKAAFTCPLVEAQRCRGVVAALPAMLMIMLLLSQLTPLAEASTDVIHTRHASIIHDSSHRDLAQHLAEVVDADYEDLLTRLDMNIGPRVDVVISDDFGDRYNASATIAYQPVVRISPIPHQRYELQQAGDTQRMVLRHELAHILTSRKGPEPGVNRLGYVPGNNMFVPLAFHEGYAQWFETDAEVGIGRAQRLNPLTEGLWRQEYQRGFQDYTQVFEVNFHEQAVLAYLYGAYFFTYLAERFGDDVVRDWTESRAADYGFFTNLITPFTLSVGWRDYFDESLADTWTDFLATETERLDAAFAADESVQPERVATDISRYRYPAAQYRGENITAWREDRDGMRRSQLVIHDNDDDSRRVYRGYQPETLTGDDNVLWFNQLEQCGREERYSLYRLSVDSGNIERVSHCERVAALSWHAPSQQLAVWQLGDGGSELRLLDANGTATRTVLRLPWDVSIKRLQWHPKEARLLVNMKPGTHANYDLYALHLDSGQWRQLTEDRTLYYGARWQEDDLLVYSRSEDGILQPFRLDVTNGQEQRLATVPHNVLEPRLDNADNTLDYLTESGYSYSRLVLPVPESSDSRQRETMVQGVIPPERPLSEPEAGSGAPLHPYFPIEHMAPTMVAPYPFWRGEFGTGEPGVGVLADWQDPTDRHQVTVNAQTLLVTTELQGTLTYVLDRQWSLGAGQALRGEARHSGYRAGWQRRFALTNRQSVSAQGQWVADHRHERSDQDARLRRWAGVSLGYGLGERTHRRYQPNYAYGLGVDYERALTEGEGNRVKLSLNLQQGLGGQHSLQSESALLWTDDAGDPFVASGQGGSEFSVFSRPLPTALTRRGLPEPLIGGVLVSEQLAYQRLSLPIMLAEPNRTAGTTGLGLSTIWLAPYANVADDLAGQSNLNVGAEVTANLSLQWLLPLSATLGYAHDPVDSQTGAVYFTLGPR